MKIVSKLTEEAVERNPKPLELQEGDYIYYDLSKSHITESDSESIRKKMMDNGFVSRIEKMWNGECINYTENRPVLHYLLRSRKVLDEVERCLKGEEDGPKRIKEDSSAVGAARSEIVEELVKVAQFSNNFGSLKGVTGKPLDTIVNIGIGGSDLGPRMVADALQFYSTGREVHFISNVDATDSLKVFKKIDPERTLFIVVSKTFTTVETIENFKLALSLFMSKVKNDFSGFEICSRHFVAVSSNVEETKKYGIQTVFKMWDFVGGRYSLWSAVGLSVSLFVGFDNYMRLLRGASAADEEFYANKEDSIPARMAINELFYISRGYNNKCLVCYDSYLELMYKYMQQAEMESNGKHGSKQMIIWGGVGTDVQHSFFQLLHQGEQNVYLEFLCPATNINLEGTGPEIEENRKKIEHHHKLLVASCIAQSRSLLVGKQSDDINHHFEGDKPSVTIMYSRLTPETLGAIIAVYEHKIFAEGVYFNINSYDQFGVQLGKAITSELMEEIEGSKPLPAELDPSSRKLLDYLKKY